MSEARLPGNIRLVEAVAPGTPPTGMVYVYAKADANTATQTFTRTRAEIFKGAAI